MDSERIGIVVGLTAEARIARRSGCRVEVGGGTAAGAEAAVRRLLAANVSMLVSFGLAGGLDPSLPPGCLLVPEWVQTGGRRIATDASVNQRLGGFTPHGLLGAASVAASVAEKRALWAATGCAAVDLESGAVAFAASAAGVPFGVLRAICDPADRDLPPAALAALDAGGAIGFWRIMVSVLGNPGQVPGLVRLAGDAKAAREALVVRVGERFRR